jgi:hypothetical protein
LWYVLIKSIKESFSKFAGAVELSARLLYFAWFWNPDKDLKVGLEVQTEPILSMKQFFCRKWFLNLFEIWAR